MTIPQSDRCTICWEALATDDGLCDTCAEMFNNTKEIQDENISSYGRSRWCGLPGRRK